MNYRHRSAVAFTTVLVFAVQSLMVTSNHAAAAENVVLSTARTETTGGVVPSAGDVVELHERFVDRSRSTQARGSRARSNSRVLPTTVLLPSHRKGAPLLVFAIGFNNSAAGYRDFLMAFARIGYIVAAPEFPLATNTLPGRPLQADVPNEPGDLRFVISAILKANAQPGPLHHLVDGGRIAVVGQSDGAISAAAIGLNACCIDRRVGAVVSISGDKSFMASTWTSKQTRPWLGIHGKADRTAPFQGSKELFRTAGPPRYLLLVDGAGHLDSTNDATLRPQVVSIIREFLRRYLFANRRALQRFSSLANVGRFHLTADPLIA